MLNLGVMPRALKQITEDVFEEDASHVLVLVGGEVVVERDDAEAGDDG